MIPNLRARLKEVANKPKAAPVEAPCQVLESRTPMADMPGLLATTPEQARWLGMDLPGFDVRRALFLDTETTGLRGAGTVAFLIGLGWVDGEDFVVRQLLMRDYPEEVDQLQRLAALLPRFDCFVTFNGKSFDIPLIRDRLTMTRLREGWQELPHLDLLHAARRTWRLRVGKCTLGTLEEAVLGMRREGDLPGALVPERYFQYLKTGDASLLDDVLRHNEQDIRSMGLILARLAGAYAAPEAQTSLLDTYSIGRALERCGEGERARRCFRVASVSTLSRQARLALAQSYRRERDYAAAADAYRAMIAAGDADVEAYTALAVLLERHLRDVSGALKVTEQALWRFAGASLFTRPDSAVIEALERRRARLKRRLDREFHTDS